MPIPPPPFRWAGSRPRRSGCCSVTQQCLAGRHRRRAGGESRGRHRPRRAAGGRGGGLRRGARAGGARHRHPLPRGAAGAQLRRAQARPAPAGRDDPRHRADDHGGQSGDQDARRQVDRGDRRRHAWPRTSSTPWPSRPTARASSPPPRAPRTSASSARRRRDHAGAPRLVVLTVQIHAAPTLRHSARPARARWSAVAASPRALGSPQRREVGTQAGRLHAALQHLVLDAGALAVGGPLGPVCARARSSGVSPGRASARSKAANAEASDRGPGRRPRRAARRPDGSHAGSRARFGPACRRSVSPATISTSAAASARPSAAAAPPPGAAVGRGERLEPALQRGGSGPSVSFIGGPPAARRASRGFRRPRRYAPPRRRGRRNR